MNLEEIKIPFSILLSAIGSTATIIWFLSRSLGRIDMAISQLQANVAALSKDVESMKIDNQHYLRKHHLKLTLLQLSADNTNLKVRDLGEILEE